MLVERPQLLESALNVERNAGSALFQDECLRILCDEFQQFDVSPVAGFVDRLGETFVGLALFRILLVEIWVKHPHQPLPKLIQPSCIVPAEFPFPLQRRCRGIVFPVFLRRLTLIFALRRFSGFLALRNQALDAGSVASSTAKGALPSGGVTGAGFAPLAFCTILRQVFAVKMFQCTPDPIC